jgi:hypothetical protein
LAAGPTGSQEGSLSGAAQGVQALSEAASPGASSFSADTVHPDDSASNRARSSGGTPSPQDWIEASRGVRDVTRLTLTLDQVERLEGGPRLAATGGLCHRIHALSDPSEQPAAVDRLRLAVEKLGPLNQLPAPLQQWHAAAVKYQVQGAHAVDWAVVAAQSGPAASEVIKGTFDVEHAAMRHDIPLTLASPASGPTPAARILSMSWAWHPFCGQVMSLVRTPLSVNEAVLYAARIMGTAGFSRASLFSIVSIKARGLAPGNAARLSAEPPPQAWIEISRAVNSLDDLKAVRNEACEVPADRRTHAVWPLCYRMHAVPEGPDRQAAVREMRAAVESLGPLDSLHDNLKKWHSLALAYEVSGPGAVDWADVAAELGPAAQEVRAATFGVLDAATRHGIPLARDDRPGAAPTEAANTLRMCWVWGPFHQRVAAAGRPAGESLDLAIERTAADIGFAGFPLDMLKSLVHHQANGNGFPSRAERDSWPVENWKPAHWRTGLREGAVAAPALT